jgi:predicted ATPase
MVYISNITILENYRTLQRGFSFDCSEVNLLVGDQGSGKSTLLGLLRENSKLVKMELSKHCLENGIPTFFFDTEKDNPRVKDPQSYTKPTGENVGIGFGAGLMSRYQSHGEIMKSLVVGPLKKAENCVVYLDEPESGLSLRNQYALAEEIHNAAKRNVQLFIATHSLILIQSVDTVVSLEHGKVMPSKEFIKLNQ